MNTIKHTLLAALSFAAVISFSACKGNVNPSKPEEITTGTITGKAVYQNAAESSGITVTLEKTDGLRSLSVVRSIELEFDDFSARSIAGNSTTDKEGNYTFTDVEEGVYTIYASSKDSTEKAVTTNVVVERNASVTAEDLKLTATGNISGKITLDNSETESYGFLVYVAGTSYSAMTDRTGTFTISGIPAGAGYSLIVTKQQLTYMFEQPVTVTAKETITIPAKNFATSEITAGNTNGKDGTSMKWLGSFASEEEIEEPKYLDAYFNTEDGCSYIYDGEKWTLLAKAGDFHIHKFSKTWTYDENYHWYPAICEHIDEIKGKAVHDWDSGIITVQPTVKLNGVMTYTCNVCKATKEEYIDRISVDDSYPICKSTWKIFPSTTKKHLYEDPMELGYYSAGYILDEIGSGTVISFETRDDSDIYYYQVIDGIETGPIKYTEPFEINRIQKLKYYSMQKNVISSPILEENVTDPYGRIPYNVSLEQFLSVGNGICGYYIFYEKIDGTEDIDFTKQHYFWKADDGNCNSGDGISSEGCILFDDRPWNLCDKSSIIENPKYNFSKAYYIPSLSKNNGQIAFLYSDYSEIQEVPYNYEDDLVYEKIPTENSQYGSFIYVNEDFAYAQLKDNFNYESVEFYIDENPSKPLSEWQYKLTADINITANGIGSLKEFKNTEQLPFGNMFCAAVVKVDASHSYVLSNNWDNSLLITNDLVITREYYRVYEKNDNSIDDYTWIGFIIWKDETSAYARIIKDIEIIKIEFWLDSDFTKPILEWNTKLETSLNGNFQGDRLLEYMVQDIPSINEMFLAAVVTIKDGRQYVLPVDNYFLPHILITDSLVLTNEYFW